MPRIDGPPYEVNAAVEAYAAGKRKREVQELIDKINEQMDAALKERQRQMEELARRKRLKAERDKRYRARMKRVKAGLEPKIRRDPDYPEYLDLENISLIWAPRNKKYPVKWFMLVQGIIPEDNPVPAIERTFRIKPEHLLLVMKHGQHAFKLQVYKAVKHHWVRPIPHVDEETAYQRGVWWDGTTQVPPAEAY